jgi:UPF0755 protein
MGRVQRGLLAMLLVLVLAPAANGATPPARSVSLKVIFPEGFSSRQMVDRVAQVRSIAIRKRHVTPVLTGAAYAAALSSAQPPLAFRASMPTRKLEGFLFPSAYKFGPSTTASQLIALQLQAFAASWKQVDLSEVATKGLDPYQTLTVASMVEREAALPAERPLIAAVIYNRLTQSMPLGIDATLRYGLGIQGTRPLTQAELLNPTPYNTRLHTGLPPTPISNPGLASMQAAAHPAAVDYLYYVRNPNATSHFFTSDYAAFCAKKAQWGYGSC